MKMPSETFFYGVRRHFVIWKADVATHKPYIRNSPITLPI
ncbi:hypothetical protein HMPREF0602_1739 [Neisseria meningitidis ATCC 13091]|uniref:Uncharacterized protein n=3 Tax=Neisseria meningitidis TaxID=487 RepID=A0A0H5QES6_NEIMI|nr:hypothetical protein HMPREF0602_1739 [Neisseria meningitidis ATCC 13091]CBA07781.1 hypothetical protein predicted by Glimmer/Critica [Neisseria meningitidis alpha153]CRY99735.1 hypothetical protein [Neisseria meningitidis serogroup B]